MLASEEVDISMFAAKYKEYYGDEISDINELYKVFCKYCKCEGYEPIIFDDRFIGIFERTQDFLIDQGLINASQCMRSLDDY